MPLIIPKTLPAYKALGAENVFVMHKERAENQHIRPLRILVLNLMPTKIVTETQLGFPNAAWLQMFHVEHFSRVSSPLPRSWPGPRPRLPQRRSCRFRPCRIPRRCIVLTRPSLPLLTTVLS